MDSKIMGLIDEEISRLPPRGRKHRYRQYENAKKRLCKKFPGYVEYEYICKALAQKYGV